MDKLDTPMGQNSVLPKVGVLIEIAALEGSKRLHEQIQTLVFSGGVVTLKLKCGKCNTKLVEHYCLNSSGFLA